MAEKEQGGMKDDSEENVSIHIRSEIRMGGKHRVNEYRLQNRSMYGLGMGR